MTAHEQQRLAALHEYRLLDAPAGDELEAVVRVAAMVAGVPTATLNLIDENRQCQLTTTGFDGGVSDRADSMCAVRFETGEFTYLPDARLDPDFAANPWVTGGLGDVRFYASAPLVTPQGHALGSLCVFHDRVHEIGPEQIDRLKDLAQIILALFERRRQARENADLAADLQRSNTELEQFAGVVSHDLAAPLTVVKGYLELLGDAPDQATAKTWVASAGRAVGRMQRLITAVLGYARAGHTPTGIEPFDLGELSRYALSDLDQAVAGATVVIPDDLPSICCDPTLMRQLLQNLIGNALKYRHPERACRIALSAAREDGHWLVSVADNGIGIPAGQRDRVFEMFTQVDPSAGSGHGVGLATCQRIVARHGGRIFVAETPGGGTTITFSVPAATR
jgi:signal transduction histidine kinase